MQQSAVNTASTAPGTRKSLTMPRCVGTGVLTQLRRGGMSCRRGIMTGRYLRAHARCLSLARARGGRGGDERAARACALLVAEVPDARAFKLALWIPETPIGADRGSLPAYLRVPSVDLRELGSSCGTSACLTLACCYESDHTVGADHRRTIGSMQGGTSSSLEGLAHCC